MLENKLIRRAFLVAIVAALAAPVSMAGKGGNKGKPGGGGPIANPALTFELNGDVQVATSGGTKQAVAADGIAAIWTPDGSQVVFLRGGPLHVVDADGDNEALLFDAGYVAPYAGLSISPDGTKILYSQDGSGADLYVLDLPRGQVQALGIGGSDGKAYSAAFGPDLDATTPGFQGLVAYGYEVTPIDSDLHVVEVVTAADGSLFVDFATIRSLPLPKDQRFPEWSPDGSQIVFLQGGGEAWGGEVLVVDYDVSTGFGSVGLLAQGLGPIGQPAWSPDGNWIAFRAAGGANGDPHNRTHSYYRIRPDGTGLTVMLSNGRRVGGFLVDWNPAWINDID